MWQTKLHIISAKNLRKIRENFEDFETKQNNKTLETPLQSPKAIKRNTKKTLN